MNTFVIFSILVVAVAANYGGQSARTMGYTQQSASAYGGPSASSYAAPAAPAYSAPVETVRVSYNSQQQDSGYAAPSAPQGGYGGQSSQSYAAPVETVRVSYNSQQQDSGYAAPASAPQGGYGGQSYAAPVAAPAYSAPVETVRVSYNSQQQDSGYGAASGGYGGASAPAQSTYGGSSYGSSSTRNNVPIIRHNQEITAGVNHQFDFATGDGISHSETTSVRQGGYSAAGGYGSSSGESNAEITKQGQYAYTAPDGQQISLSYTADAQGFHPQGAHLPTPPPIPQEIAQSLRAQGHSGY